MRNFLCLFYTSISLFYYGILIIVLIFILFKNLNFLTKFYTLATFVTLAKCIKLIAKDETVKQNFAISILNLDLLLN